MGADAMENIIAVVLPYWQRQAAAIAGLQSVAYWNVNTRMELIVVDDGDPVPFVADGIDHAVRIVRLPEKSGAKSACVPINRGVEAALGEVIVLSCPEMLHVMPTFPAMLRALVLGGANAYVSASVWAPESNVWHVHGTR